MLSGNNQVTLTADDNYITKSIYDPDSEIVKGYNKGLMKSYKDVLKENDIKVILDYLKTLGEKL